MEPQESLVNQPLDPKELAKQSLKTAGDAQQQFIPSIQADTETRTHMQEEAQGQHSFLVDIDRFVTKYTNPVQKVISWVLIYQGVDGLWKSIRFILIEMPQKSLLVNQGMITQHEANELASKAILMILDAVLSMVFAVKLSALQSKTAEHVQTAIGILLMLANAWIMGFLDEHGSASLIGSTIDALLKLAH